MAGQEPVDRSLTEVGAGRLDRRSFVLRLGLLGVGPGAAAALLSACGDSESTPPTTAADGTTSAADKGGTTTADAAGSDEVPGPPWKGGKRGGTATVVWSDQSVVYDPPLAYDLGGYYGLQNFYRGLGYYGLNAEPQLDEAESLDISDDGLQLRFKIKSGLTFHNGREVTAADYKWTFERAMSKQTGSWVQGFLAALEGHAPFVEGKAKQITGLQAVDPTTLVMKLTRRDVTIPGVVSIPPFYVLPKEEVTRLGDKLNQNPVGTGPWTVAEWNTGRREYVTERFANYQYADKLPYLDSLRWQWGIAPDLQYLKVSRDQADAAIELPPAVVNRLKADKSQAERFKQWDSFSLVWWGLDVTKPPFDDVRVRRAVNHAFNRERAAHLGYNANGHFWPSGLLGYDEGAPVYEYDPEKARALLAEAGASGVQLTLPTLGATPGASRTSQLLQQDLQAVGFKVNLKQLQETTFDLGAKVRQQYRIWNLGWGMGLPDPAELYNSLIATNAPSNYGGYSNPKIDQIGKTAQGETDRDKRGEMYAEMERLLIEDAAFLFLGVDLRSTYTSKSLRNFVWEPVLWSYWDRFWKA